MIFRRFGEVFTRLLLHKQDQIRELEEELHDCDALDASDDERARYLQSRETDEIYNAKDTEEGSRANILERLERKILEYSE